MSTTEHPAPLFRLLADPVGWHLVTNLAQSDYLVGDLATLLEQPPEQVSHYLTTLHQMGLVNQRQSDANPADTFYRLDLLALRDAFSSAGLAIHPVVGGVEDVTPEALPPTKQRVLFLCTGNSARSQMAEGLMCHLSKGKVDVVSAGSQPSQVHPLAVETMQQAGIDITQQRSKHMDEFLGQTFDYVITVCDRQREACPVFPGNPQQYHWSFPDPVTVEPEHAREQAFKSTANQLRNLIQYFLIAMERKQEN